MMKVVNPVINPMAKAMSITRITLFFPIDNASLP
jgi:hypothetical protein